MPEIKMITIKHKRKYFHNVTMNEDDDKIYFNFTYQSFLELGEHIKAMDGVKWDKESKTWSVKNSPRNWWWISYLMGKNPYEWYDRPLIDYVPEPKKCYRCKGKGCSVCGQMGVFKHFTHQIETTQHNITYKQTINAEDMGLGKTLSVICTIDYAISEESMSSCIYIAPRSALVGVGLEIEKWGCRLNNIKFMTYDQMKKIAATHEVPQILIFDEAHELKNPTSQRSEAATLLANRVRSKYGKNCYIIGMTGTPAPKSPADWYNLCEVVCPGFLKEGNLFKFKQRLGLSVQKESPSGGVYPELITWYDDEKKCKICGQLKDDFKHEGFSNDFHSFEPSVNEVKKLYRRLKGLVIVKSKKDCLDLPEKRFELVQLKPTQEILNAAELIKANCARAIQVLIRCRELSDGFQYRTQEQGERECTLCFGTGQIPERISPRNRYCPECEMEFPVGEVECEFCGNVLEERCGHCNAVIEDCVCQIKEDTIQRELVECTLCHGTRRIPKLVKVAVEIPCPKEQQVKDDLELHEEIGRIVFYAGFTASVNKLVRLCKEQKWTTIKVDGHGWVSDISTNDQEMIRAFQLSDQEKIAYIAHPQSGGQGLTLTRSPTACYYSNDFNGKARMQSMDRIHRPGMDVNLGATIKDYIHLPTDLYVLDNLLKKTRLQDLTMGRLIEELNTYEGKRKI